MPWPVVGYDAAVSDNPRAPGRIASFATALGVFGGTAAGVLVAGRRAGQLPDHYRPTDLVVGALATQKFTRLLAKDSVTTPLRAPFTRFEEAGAPAEVNERPKEHNAAQHTLGELLVCPFCLAPWVAGAYVTGLALAPRVARAWAAVFGIVGVADDLQHVYARLQVD
jgi:hypothetical protein